MEFFIKEGTQTLLRGFLFNIVTGKPKPLCCKQPRYGTHEIKVITKLAHNIHNKIIIMDNDVSYGALLFLAEKLIQKHAHWSQYVLRLCVSCWLLKTGTRPYTYQISQCDESVDGFFKGILFPSLLT